MYQDREGKLYDYDTCIREFEEYQKRHLDYFKQRDKPVRPKDRSIFLFLKRKVGGMLSLETKNFLNRFIKISQ